MTNLSHKNIQFYPRPPALEPVPYDVTIRRGSVGSQNHPRPALQLSRVI
jgi:hypothetical protein